MSTPSAIEVCATASRVFHRWRYNEMVLATCKMTETRKDTKTMERAASSYAKYNRVDLEDDQTMPYDMIVPQCIMDFSHLEIQALSIRDFVAVTKDESVDELIDRQR